MTEGIIIALIGSGFTLAATVITVVWGNKKNAQRSKEQTDLTVYRIKELEKKQDKYNHLQERVAKMERHDAAVDAKINDMRDDIKDIKRMISEK